jgi:hypothetical protein
VRAARSIVANQKRLGVIPRDAQLTPLAGHARQMGYALPRGKEGDEEAKQQAHEAGDGGDVLAHQNGIPTHGVAAVGAAPRIWPRAARRSRTPALGAKVIARAWVDPAFKKRLLSPRMVHIIEALATDWRRLDERIEALSSEIAALAEDDAACQRLMTLPGIGPIISSATVAAIGMGDIFSKGRDFSAWLGLVPKQMSTGGRPLLGRISKRGNRYLRALFVQAARVVLRLGPDTWERHGLKRWIQAAATRMHHNKLAIALANKLARIAWSVLHHGRDFQMSKLA